MMEILENRKDDGLSLQLRKAEKATTEVDHGLDSIYIWIIKRDPQTSRIWTPLIQ